MSEDNRIEVGPSGGSSVATRTGRTGKRLPSGQLRVEEVPLPLPGRDRTAWRVAALLVCLDRCRGRSATIEQLHVLMWALRDQENASLLKAVWDGAAGAPRSLRAWDPSLDDTLALARAAGLVEQRPNGRQKLSAKGASVVAALRDDEAHPLEEEQATLSSLGQLTESGMWDRLGRRGAGRQGTGES